MIMHFHQNNTVKKKNLKYILQKLLTDCFCMQIADKISSIFFCGVIEKNHISTLIVIAQITRIEETLHFRYPIFIFTTFLMNII